MLWSTIYPTITWTPQDCSKDHAMPRAAVPGSRTQLSICDRRETERWVREGFTALSIVAQKEMPEEAWKINLSDYLAPDIEAQMWRHNLLLAYKK